MFSEEGCPYWKLDVPQQTNSSDCGLFMLHSIEQFIRDPSAVRAAPSPGETLCGFDSGVFGIGALRCVRRFGAEMQGRCHGLFLVPCE